MKKGIKLFSALFFILVTLPLWAQISDQQVVSMIQRMEAQGLNAQQIAAALAQSGATQEQLLRIKTKVESDVQSDKTTELAEPTRLRDAAQTVIDAKEEAAREETAGTDSLPRFGRSFFTNNRLSFEPRFNIATPENYILGPGDEVIIDIWGNARQTVRQKISPEGSILVDPVGLIRLNGLSVSQARVRVRQAFANVYSLDDGGTQFNLTLGEIRSIQVHVMGEAMAPGTYTVSSLATLFHVLYRAGGVNNIGSLRDIRVNRAGKEVAVVDVYEYLMWGRSDLDISLKDGDVVMVKPYANIVTVTGKVKRPMSYELTTGESLETLIEYAGGFTGDAYTVAVRVDRKSGREYRVFNVDAGEYDSFLLADCDEVFVEPVLDRFENKIEIKGAVFRPGIYALGGDVTTVRQLVAKAEGLRGDVFTGHAMLYRLRNDYTPEALALDIGALMDGTAEDVELRKDDVLEVSSIFDLKENYTVSINGKVGSPGEYPWVDNMTLEDLVIRAGGLLESASTVRVDVAQRIKDPKSVTETRAKSIHLSFALKDGLVVEGDRNYVLHPFDVVYVRTSPGYSVQQNVSINGQVLFGGSYALTMNNERMSELVRKAGGLTADAYVKGARLMRVKTNEERAREESALGLVRNVGHDSLSVENLNFRDEYSVAINLDKALAQPGSDYDLVLREGDVLHVPEYQGTVMVCGAVIYPNTVSYRKGANTRHYVSQGGGYANRARRRKTYVIHMNGMVEESRFLSRPKVTPGCMVVVPMKAAPRNRMTSTEIMGMTTSVASLGAIVTSLLNMNK